MSLISVLRFIYYYAECRYAECRYAESCGAEHAASDPEIKGLNPAMRNRRRKMFKNCSLYYKTSMIVIYDRNDSGKYYKTMITIVYL